jgi:hypothetical protein
MPTCANCSEVALYTYQVADGYNINYCQAHLPRFLFSRRDAGLLPVVSIEPVVEPTPAPKSKKSAPVDSPVEETAVTSDAVN